MSDSVDFRNVKGIEYADNNHVADVIKRFGLELGKKDTRDSVEILADDTRKRVAVRKLNGRFITEWQDKTKSGTMKSRSFATYEAARTFAKGYIEALTSSHK